MDDRTNPERNHQISVLRGKIAHKTGVEREEAIRAYRRVKYGQERTPDLPIRAWIPDDPSGLSLLMTEPERGLEPTDLPFTKRLLSQLSYSGTTFTNL